MCNEAVGRLTTGLGDSIGFGEVVSPVYSTVCSKDDVWETGLWV